MAIGATPRQVFSLIFRRGFLTVVSGLGSGLIAAGICLRWLPDAVNIAPLWIAIALVTLTATFACWIPSRRATAIDPSSALREE